MTAARRLLLAAALVWAGCGGGGGGSGGGPSGSPTATPVPTPAVTSTPASTPTPGPTSSGVPPLRLSEIASGLDQPLFVAAAPGDRTKLYVVEQTGRIRVIENGSLRATPFLDLSDRVSCCNERGLLGLAFHPSYPENGRLFVDYTDVAGNTVIEEFVGVPGNPEQIDPSSGHVLLHVAQPFPNHNGGMLAFAPDGTMVIALGDGGGAGDPNGNAQNPSSRLGKLLRVDVDHVDQAPPGNLPGGDPLVWQLGLRNPWRFSFDRVTGDLWIGDVGQDRYEEVDFAPAGQGGLNFGWPVTEGLHCYKPATGCDETGFTLPVHEYSHDFGCSVIGGYVYRGAIPGLAGHYFFGDFCSDRLWLLTPNGDAPASVTELTQTIDPDGRVSGLSSFGEDLDGELYVVGNSGSVFRIEGAADDSGS